MRKTILIFPVLALVAALLLIGCGGSDDGGNTTSSKEESSAPLSKEEFIKRADAICTKADFTQYRQGKAYRERHEEELNKLPPVVAEEKLIRLFTLPSIRKQIAEVRALGAPKGEEKQVEKILKGLEKAADEAEKDPYAIEGEVPSENPFRRIDIIAREYGFEDCRNLA